MILRNSRETREIAPTFGSVNVLDLKGPSLIFVIRLYNKRDFFLKQSYVIADRIRSQRKLFPYNHRRLQTIAQPTEAMHFVQRKCQMYSCENQSKQHGGHRGGNIFLFFISKSTTTSASKPKQTSKNIHEETR